MSKKLTDHSIKKIKTLNPNDKLYIVDTNDLTDGKEGTSKYVTPEDLAEQLYNCTSGLNLPGSIFTIFAEERSALGSNSYEWSFGDSDASQSGFGIVIPFRSELIALTLNIRGGKATVEARNNKASSGLSITANPIYGLNAYTVTQKSIIYQPGDILGFKTLTSSNVSDGGKVAAWFRTINQR